MIGGFIGLGLGVVLLVLLMSAYLRIELWRMKRERRRKTAARLAQFDAAVENMKATYPDW